MKQWYALYVLLCSYGIIAHLKTVAKKIETDAGKLYILFISDLDRSVMNAVFDDVDRLLQK